MAGDIYLNLDSTIKRLSLLLRPRNGFLSHDTSTPVTFRLFVFLRVAFFDRGDELRELGFVFRSDFGEGEDGCCLLITWV